MKVYLQLELYIGEVGKDWPEPVSLKPNDYEEYLGQSDHLLGEADLIGVRVTG